MKREQSEIYPLTGSCDRAPEAGQNHSRADGTVMPERRLAFAQQHAMQ